MRYHCLQAPRICAHPARVSKRRGQEKALVTAFCSIQFISLHLQLTIYGISPLRCVYV